MTRRNIGMMPMQFRSCSGLVRGVCLVCMMSMPAWPAVAVVSMSYFHEGVFIHLWRFRIAI
jgi:hypothetical protein